MRSTTACYPAALILSLTALIGPGRSSSLDLTLTPASIPSIFTSKWTTDHLTATASLTADPAYHETARPAEPTWKPWAYHVYHFQYDPVSGTDKWAIAEKGTYCLLLHQSTSSPDHDTATTEMDSDSANFLIKFHLPGPWRIPITAVADYGKKPVHEVKGV